MLGFASLKQVAMPPTGWIKPSVTAIGMSMQQLGNKLNISQGVPGWLRREKTVPLPSNRWKEIAVLWICSWCMGFVPLMTDRWMPSLKNGQPNWPPKLWMRTAPATMKLEDQANSKKRIWNRHQGKGQQPLKNENAQNFMGIRLRTNWWPNL